MYLFTSLTCPHCPAAKTAMDEIAEERTDADFQKLSLEQPNAQRLAKTFGVQSVPTFIIQGPEHEGNIGLVGSQSKDTLNKYLDIASGKKQIASKESFITKLKKKFKVTE